MSTPPYDYFVFMKIKIVLYKISSIELARVITFVVSRNEAKI